MVLCPFVYLQMCHSLPPLALQPTEVHSAHWMSLEGLLSPSLRSEVRCDISDRFTRDRSPFLRMCLRALAGRLIFGAVRLKPTESLHCNFIPNAAPDIQASKTISSLIANNFRSSHSDEDDKPLLLWGLTLGIMADLLENIDKLATSKLWQWPTFSPWDIRLVIWLLNRRIQTQRIQEITNTANEMCSPENNGIYIGGIDNSTYSTSVKRRSQGSEAGVTGMMLLTGYTGHLRRAFMMAMLLRVTLGAALTALLFCGS